MINRNFFNGKNRIIPRAFHSFMKMAFASLLFCYFGTGGLATYAAEPDTFAQNPHQVGVKGGLNSGKSIVYRYWPTSFGIEGALGPRVNNTYTEIHSGIAGLITILRGRVVDYYGTIGNDVFYTEGASEFLSPYGKAKQGVTWDVKAGLGIEVEIVDRFIINGVFGIVNERMIRDNFDGKFNAEFSLLYAF